MKKLFAIIISALSIFLLCPLAACSPEQENSSAYDIEVSFDGDRTLTGRVTLTYFNDTQNALSELKFNLFGNAFRQDALFKPVSDAYSGKAYYDGESFGEMTISSVVGGEFEVSGSDKNILTVTLDNTIYPDETAVVEIEYALTLAKVNHRTGISSSTVNLGNFYPILCAYSQEGFVECNYYPLGDPFMSECASYSVTLTCPSEFVVASSGKLLTETASENQKTATYALTNARDFAFVLSKNFKVATTVSHNTTINYYYLNDQNPDLSLKAASESFEYFSANYGEYIYPTLSVVQSGFCYGGMEYPALTLISDTLSESEKIYTIVHENAHQWWYAMVGSNQLTAAWQDEGLAEFSSLDFFEHYSDYGFTRTGIIGSATASYRSFFTVYKQLSGDCDTSMNRNLSTFSGEYEYVNISYNKGMILFDTLKQALGDEFYVGLRRYFTNNVGKIAAVENIIADFSKNTDAASYFYSFIDGKTII